jgi:hypothetical protein
MKTAKEVERVKYRLRTEADNADEHAARQRALAKYAKRSAAKMRKGKRPKKGKRDLFSGDRLPGSAYSKQG